VRSSLKIPTPEEEEKLPEGEKNHRAWKGNVLWVGVEEKLESK